MLSIPLVKCRWERGFCPLSGIEKRPLLGSFLSITSMVISIRNTDSVRCREVVRFSEGPLSQVRLYMDQSSMKVHIIIGERSEPT